MKKKLSLSGLQVKSFKTNLDKASGGHCPPLNTSPVASQEPEFCDYTCNAWCASRGRTDCYRCTTPY